MTACSGGRTRAHRFPDPGRRDPAGRADHSIGTIRADWPNRVETAGGAAPGTISPHTRTGRAATRHASSPGRHRGSCDVDARRRPVALCEARDAESSMETGMAGRHAEATDVVGRRRRRRPPGEGQRPGGPKGGTEGEHRRGVPSHPVPPATPARAAGPSRMIERGGAADARAAPPLPEGPPPYRPDRPRTRPTTAATPQHHSPGPIIPPFSRS